MTVEPLLRVRDLQVEFSLARGTLRAVDGASFEVEPGEALGIVGESGSGKTMALRALVGLLPRGAQITGGTVEIDGVDVTAAGEDKRRELRGTTVSMIFQEPMTALNPVMRVGDQIAEEPLVRLGLSRSAAKARALELMGLVGIPDPRRRQEAYPHELSGGMRQRVMIAIALSGDPKLVLCDEPTTALDVTIQDQILKLLQQLQRELDVSLVFVSHDLAVIAQTCRRLAVMYAGQVVESGTVAEVFREPRHPYTLGAACVRCPTSTSCASGSRRSRARRPTWPRRRPDAASIRVASSCSRTACTIRSRSRSYPGAGRSGACTTTRRRPTCSASR